MIELTLDHLFKMASKDSDIDTIISLSFLEIYNENVRDLLSSKSTNLNVVEDPVKGMTVVDLQEFVVKNPAHAKEIVSEGIEKRSMNATKSNEVSSRSHAILQFSIKRIIKKESEKVTMLESKFFMIDLAGN